MKKIIINGETYYYEIAWTEIGEYSYDVRYTKFYKSVKLLIKKRKKYYLFGPIVEYFEKPEPLFVLWIDIESPNYTKEEILNKIERELKLVNRKEEIERGEII